MNSIKEYLDENNMSQRDLAKALEITDGAVSQWISGLTKPSTEMAKKIKTHTGLSLDAILFPDETTELSQEKAS